MKKKLDEHIRSIAIFRALQLGDMLCAVPAVRALRNAYPHARITLIGMSWSESFVDRFPHYFDDFIHFPGYPGLPEQPFDLKSFISFLERVNKESFDLLVQMHGNGSVINPLMPMLGARCMAGYRQEGRWCPDESTFINYPEGIPEIERHLRLVDFLGIPSQGDHLELPVYDKEHKSFESLCRLHGLEKGKYVCVHPGARDNKRWWSPENFAEVADAIAERGYRIVITGTAIEREAVGQVAAAMKHPAVELAGKTDLGTLAVLVKNARLLLSNDTGVSHIAAAVKTPSIVIFLASDPSRWAPLNRKLHLVVLPEEAGNIKYVLDNTSKLLDLQPGELVTDEKGGDER
jgi:ADP-heptose:LPS heptosyltransferase